MKMRLRLTEQRGRGDGMPDFASKWARGRGWFFCRAGLLLVLLPAAVGRMAFAGGPRWVAGPGYFDSGAKGQPVVWAGGEVVYFTDQGDLSAAVTQAQANTMVAQAAAVWSSVPTAAVSITWGGSLGEDVNGSNVAPGANGVTMPVDLEPTATAEPVGVVYDADGSVIDALYGQGASEPLTCQYNGVLQYADHFAVTGNVAHAVILVNGLCATTPEQIAMLEYELVRAFGRVLGLDWSEANEAMFASGQITSDGLAGWPVMHPVERLCNGSGGTCLPNATTLRPDDVAALNRLYPVTEANLGSFPGKTLTAAATISVTGTVTFPRGQGMQGVNVVLQPVVDGVPQIAYTATAVSGAYFAGNAGNPVTGRTDGAGNPLDRWGSDDASLEGFFDLRFVPLPPGMGTADYQLTFEAVNPEYVQGESVGPYVTGQVSPSGGMPVVDLGTLGPGQTSEQNVVLEDAANEAQSGEDGTETEPAPVAETGEWTGRIVGYGHTGWFAFWASGGREFTVEAQALDESGAATENKAELVIGAWNGADAAGTAAVTATAQPFNGSGTGLTTLPVLTAADSDVRIGLADFRGDGRPDYAYRARILYADSVTPARIPVSGGTIVIRGMGFRANSMVLVNNVAAPVIAVTPTTIVASAPASNAAGQSAMVEVADPETLGVAKIGSGVSYDAEPEDAIGIVSGPEGTEPMGVPLMLRVRAIDTTTGNPAAGVTVTVAVTEGAAALGCGQNSCSLMTAGDGTASLVVIATTAALAQVTASLANGSIVLAEFTGTSPPAVVAMTPNLYMALGSTVQWPVEVMAVSASGAPLAGQSITWSGATGAAVTTAQTVTAADGTSKDQAAVGPFNASVSTTVQACLTGTGNCAAFTVVPVHLETAMLSAWSGTAQFVGVAQTFAPVVLKVTDAFGNPLAGAAVTFYESLDGWTEPCPGTAECPQPPVLAQGTWTAISGVDGLVTLAPIAPQGFAARLHVLAVLGQTTLGVELDAGP